MLKVIVNCVILSSYTSKIDDLNIENYKLSYLSHVFFQSDNILSFSWWCWFPSHWAVSCCRNIIHIYFLPMNCRIWSKRLDDLWTDDQSLLDNKDTCVILMDTWRVSARCDCHQVIWESLNTIWADWMGSDHHSQVVSLKEWV